MGNYCRIIITKSLSKIAIKKWLRFKKEDWDDSILSNKLNSDLG